MKFLSYKEQMMWKASAVNADAFHIVEIASNGNFHGIFEYGTYVPYSKEVRRGYVLFNSCWTEFSSSIEGHRPFKPHRELDHDEVCIFMGEIISHEEATEIYYEQLAS